MLHYTLPPGRRTRPPPRPTPAHTHSVSHQCTSPLCPVVHVACPSIEPPSHHCCALSRSQPRRRAERALVSQLLSAQPAFEEVVANGSDQEVPRQPLQYLAAVTHCTTAPVRTVCCTSVQCAAHLRERRSSCIEPPTKVAVRASWPRRTSAPSTGLWTRSPARTASTLTMARTTMDCVARGAIQMG